MTLNRSRLLAIFAANSLLRLAVTTSSSTGLIAYFLADMSMGDATIGRLNATFNFFALASAIPGGILIDRNSPRLVLVIGAVLGAIATQLFAMSGGNPAFFYVSRALEGIGASLALPGILAYLTDITEERPDLRGRVMSWFEVTLFIGIALGTLIAGELWQRVGTAAFAWMAVAYIVAAIVFFWGASHRSEHHVVKSSSSLASLRQAMSDDALRRLAIPWLIFNTALGIFLAHMTFQLSVRDGGEMATQWLVARFDPDNLSLLMFGFVVFYSVGMLIWGRQMGRIPRTTIMRNSFIALACLMGIMFLVNSSTDWPMLWRVLLLIPAMVAIIFQGGFPPAALAYLADVAGQGEGRGTSMGIYTFLLSLGSVIGAFVGNIVGEPFALNGMLGAILILAVLGWLALNIVPSNSK